MKLRLGTLILTTFLLAAITRPVWGAPPPQGISTPSPTIENTVTAYDLITAVNQARTSNGLPALKVNAILMGTAQYTAEVMAANQMSGHIGGVSERVRAAGYAPGDTAWATENFVIGPLPVAQVMAAWSDAVHSIPAVNPAYCDIGAGVAEANGAVYYVVHAAYSDRHACGEYRSPEGTTLSGATPAPRRTGTAAAPSVPQWIIPVATATPRPDGRILHEVKAGQTLWAIAVAYNVKILDLVSWNGIPADNQTVYLGQKLIIPNPADPALHKGTPQTPTTVATTPTPALSPTTVTAGPIPVAMSRQVNTQTPTPLPSAAPTVPAENPPSLEQAMPYVVGATIGLGLLLVLFGLVYKR